MSTSSNTRKLAFALITVVCVAGAVIYTLRSARMARRKTDMPATSSSARPLLPGRAQEKPMAPPALEHPAPARDIQPIRQEAKLVAINLSDSPDRGKVEYSVLNAADRVWTTTDLSCERVYFARNHGICLRREAHLWSAQTVAVLIDEKLQAGASVRIDGIPSRARVSPDGRLAAFTVFVTGHSYADAQVSTATLLVNVEEGTTLANLEEFKVVKDGGAMQSPDFNYWGVTFQKDSNFFYATLRTGGTNYLVRGDIRARQVTVIHPGVECPSLSPDETRVAFKKLVSRNNWRLTVLNLASLQETPLAETQSVDDQAEWLDNGHVLYGMVDSAPWMSIMVVAADGSGLPKVFAKGAMSPAVVR
jgi:hypothetical protein